MVEYLLTKLCNLFGYTIIPIPECTVHKEWANVINSDQDITVVKCTKDEYVSYNGQLINGCQCETCLPW